MSKKTHKWEIMENIYVRCPYCGKYFDKDGFFDVGDEIECSKCGKIFILGNPR
jgi:DNA-directed RNA polymerase subunit RPC12/RpoP